MDLKGLIFDVNGTLIDILTDEGNEEIYRGISHFLTYQGIFIHRFELKDEYFRIMDAQRKGSPEKYPEFDTVALWREFLARRPEQCAAISAAKLKWLPVVLAEMYRGVSRNRLVLYPGVREVLDELAGSYRLAAVTDAQSAWAVSEMRAVEIDGYFSPIVVSGDLGYRKPDQRLFDKALKAMRLAPQNVIFVGNDIYRDVYGAQQLGMKTVFFSSNQGRKEMNGVKADYDIFSFAQLRDAVAFLQDR